jgi:hypothetical protein
MIWTKKKVLVTTIICCSMFKVYLFFDCVLQPGGMGGMFMGTAKFLTVTNAKLPLHHSDVFMSSN